MAPVLFTARKEKLAQVLIHEFIQSTSIIECGYSLHIIPGARGGIKHTKGLAVTEYTF